jgi:hypothetical protein
VLARWCAPVGGGWRWGGEIREREGLAEKEGSIASRFSCFPSMPNRKRQEREICKSLDSRKNCPAGLPSPLGRFAKKRKREKKRKTWDRVIKSEIQDWKLNPPNRSEN